MDDISIWKEQNSSNLISNDKEERKSLVPKAQTEDNAVHLRETYK